MSSDDTPLFLAKRRTTMKKINYNEKRADAELAKKIKLLEKTKGKSKSGTGSNKKKNGFKYQGFLNDKATTWNFIPSLPPSFRKNSRFSNVLELDGAIVNIKEQTLLHETATVLRKDDHIYMISEPPGEPYYIGRIMEFVCKPEYHKIIENSREVTAVFPAKYFNLKMNWYYRSRDIRDNVHNVDPRLVYASLHTDVCPLISYRGKCTVLHRSELDFSTDFAHEYITKANTFYFDQLFDRYTLKYYDVWSTRELLQLSTESIFLKALNCRFPFIFTEEKFPLQEVIKRYVMGIIPENSTWDQRCGKCKEWCDLSDCVKCDQCKVPLHLYCLDPPIDRKPSRGFVWICFSCVKKQGEISSENTRDDQEQKSLIDRIVSLENSAKESLKQSAEINNDNWWFQYFGTKLISKMEDVLSTQMVLPFPIKCSRIDPKKQWSRCSENEWKREPYGLEELGQEKEVSERGTDQTADLLWIIDSSKLSEEELDSYVKRCQQEFPPKLQILPQTSNFLDMVVKLLVENNYNTELAFQACEKKLNRQSLREPTLSAEEIEKFEKAVAEYGSELHPVCKSVGTQPMSMIVRFYYYWKKTPRGREVWGNFKGRNKNKKKEKEKNNSSQTSDLNSNRKSRERKPSQSYLESNLDNNKEWKYMDDSSFDSERISKVKTCFQCMFCQVDYSPMWYRITGGCDDENIRTRMITGVNEKTSTSDKLPHQAQKKDSKEDDKLDALCIRCARLWRRYATRWQPPLDTLKRLNGGSNSNVQNTLEELLSDPDEGVLKASPKLAHAKFLEWELVQDAELIVKQRYDIMNNPSRLSRMKRNCLSTHTQLNKLVKRLVLKDAYNENKMKAELENYISNQKAELKKKEGKKTKKLKPKLENENYETQEGVTIIQQTPGQQNATEKSVVFRTTPKSSSVSDELQARVPQKRIKKIKHMEITKPITSNGEIILDISADGGCENLGRVSIDPDFENIKLTDPLCSKLLQSFKKRCISKTTETDTDATCDSGGSKRKKQKSEESYDIDPSVFQVVNESNIPVVKEPHNSIDMLRTYYKYNPLYYHWAHGELRKLKLDLAHSTVQTSQILTNNNLGRKSKSPTFEIDHVDIPGEFQPRNFCCVCLDKFDDEKDEEIVCANCGLNVHYYCYGVPSSPSSKYTSSPSKLKDQKWLCDPCSNDLNPLISTNYQCCLCTAKEIDHDAAKKNINRAVPDALKTDTNGSWCHVICALFNEDLAFGSSQIAQPVCNVGATLLKNSDKKCDICNLLGGGLEKCAECNYQFHVTCAQDTPGFRLLFQKMVFEKSMPRKLAIIENDEQYVIKPVILCFNHPVPTSSMLPLGRRISSGVTLMEFYMKNYKSVDYKFNSIMKVRSREQYFMMHQEQELSKSFCITEKSLPAKEDIFKYSDDVATEALDLETPKKCTKCSSDCSIYWYGSVCHACHLSKLKNMALCEVEDEETNDDAEPEQKGLVSVLEKKLLEGIDYKKLVIDFSSTENRKKVSGAGSGRGRKKGSKNKKLATVDLKKEGKVGMIKKAVEQSDERQSPVPNSPIMKQKEILQPKEAASTLPEAVSQQDLDKENVKTSLAKDEQGEFSGKHGQNSSLHVKTNTHREIQTKSDNIQLVQKPTFPSEIASANLSHSFKEVQAPKNIQKPAPLSPDEGQTNPSGQAV